MHPILWIKLIIYTYVFNIPPLFSHVNVCRHSSPYKNSLYTIHILFKSYKFYHVDPTKIKKVSAILWNLQINFITQDL